VKTYRGTPGPPEAVVTVEDANGSVRTIDPPVVGFGWGNGGPASTQLALMFAMDMLGSREHATCIYQRLKHRTVATWRADQPWTITEAELRAQIDDILKVERETAQARAMVAQEPAPIVMEGGRDIVWDSAEPGARR
jgi:hypothetical protein